MRFAQEGVEQSPNRHEQLLGCRSIQEFMALQTQIVREHLELLLHTARRTAEQSSRIAEEASQRMGDATLAPRWVSEIAARSLVAAPGLILHAIRSAWHRKLTWCAAS